MHVHSPHQYLVPEQKWYKVAQWWKVSRGCSKDWRFYEHLNVWWRSTSDSEGGLILNSNNIDTEQQSTATTTSGGYQTMVFGIPDQLLCPWAVLCTVVESCRGETIQKSNNVIANLGGRRPPRRVRAYNSTNNRELNNTCIVLRQNIYLVRLYGQQLQ